MKVILISTGSKNDQGIYFVSKTLNEHNHRTEILFSNYSNLDEIKNKIKDSGLIVVSANEETAHIASKIISSLKILQKPIAYAGIYPSLYPERAIKETDLVIISKPRDTILELANKLQNFQRVADIENLWFKATEEQVIKN